MSPDSILMFQVANQTMNNDPCTEEEILAWISVISYQDVLWLHRKP